MLLTIAASLCFGLLVLEITVAFGLACTQCSRDAVLALATSVGLVIGTVGQLYTRGLLS